MQQLETLASVWLWIPQMIQPLMGYMHWIGLLSRKVRPRKILISTVPAAEILHLLRLPPNPGDRELDLLHLLPVRTFLGLVLLILADGHLLAAALFLSFEMFSTSNSSYGFTKIRFINR